MDRLNSRSDGGSASLFLKNQTVNIHFQATLSQLQLLSCAGVMHEAPQMVCKQMGALCSNDTPCTKTGGHNLLAPGLYTLKRELVN